MDIINELKQKQRDILDQMKKMNDRADKAKRNFSPMEQTQWENLSDRFDDLTDKIREKESSQNRETPLFKQLPLNDDDNNEFRNLNFDTIGDKTMLRKLNNKDVVIYDKRALQKAVENDNYGYDPKGTELRDSFNRYLLHGQRGISDTEFRALQSDIDGAGGYLKMPVMMANHIIVTLDNLLHIRQKATSFQLTKSDTFRVPELATDVSDPNWHGEITETSEDSDMDFSARDFTCHPMSRLVKCSNKLLRLSVLNPENIVRNRLMTVARNVLENAYLNGNGIGKPLGLFVSSDFGLDSSRDIESSVAASFTADDFINVEGELKQQYRRNAAWLVSRSCLTRLRKMKDGEGNYLLNQNMRQGGAESLLGYPIMVSEYAPSTWSSGYYCAILGDFSFYYIIDNLDMQIIRLDELYQLTNQVGFIFRYEGDGNIVDKNAFVRLKLK